MSRTYARHEICLATHCATRVDRSRGHDNDTVFFSGQTALKPVWTRRIVGDNDKVATTWIWTQTWCRRHGHNLRHEVRHTCRQVGGKLEIGAWAERDTSRCDTSSCDTGNCDTKMRHRKCDTSIRRLRKSTSSLSYRHEHMGKDMRWRPTCR